MFRRTHTQVILVAVFLLGLCSAQTCELKDTISKLVEKEAAKTVTDWKHGGAVFTRWGRTTCPSGNELIYKGSAGGNGHHHRAGPSNTLCLPEDPEYGKITPNHHSQGQIYGAEYESTIHYIKHLVNHDVPCAVCRSRKRRSVIMVPAKMTCHPGWHREYHGFLMSGHIKQSASQYMCLDAKPETIYSGLDNKGGQLFYLVEGICGSLPCPPYKNNGELTCVVCSK